MTAVRRFIWPLVAVVALTSPAAAQKKKSAGKRKGKPAVAATAQSGEGEASGKKSRAPRSSPTKDAGDDLESPYGEQESSEDTTGDDPAAAAGAAQGSGDPKLDEPPPKRSDAAGGVRPSPLNPEANEFPDGKPRSAPPDLAKLMSDITALRSRVAALTTSLFSSNLKIYIETDGDDSRISSLAVTLDDGVVFRAPARFVVEEARVVFDHSVAPGHHVVGLEVERYDARSKAFKTWQTTKFSVLVPEKQRVEADLVVDDDSDMAEDFADDQDGEYDLRVRLRAKVVD